MEFVYLCHLCVIPISSLIGILYLSKDIKDIEHKLFICEKAPQISPGGLIEILMRGSDLIIKKHFSENNQDKSQLSGFVFLEGVISSPLKIKSFLNKAKEIIFSFYFRKGIYYNEVYQSQQKQQIQQFFIKSSQFLPKKKSKITVSSAPFYKLTDKNNRNFACRIEKNISAKFIKSLSIIQQTNVIKNQLSYTEKFLAYTGYLIELFLQLCSQRNEDRFDDIPLFTKGKKIGYEQIEVGIINNTAITVFGEVVYNKADKSLKMKKPKYFLRYKQDLIEMISTSLFKKKITRGVLFLSLIISLFFLFKKIKALHLFYRQKQIRLNKLNDKLHGVQELQISHSYCLICLKNPKSIIIKPCTHFCLCIQCSFMTKTCPECGKNIQETVKIFVV